MSKLRAGDIIRLHSNGALLLVNYSRTLHRLSGTGNAPRAWSGITGLDEIETKCNYDYVMNIQDLVNVLSET